MPRPVPKNPWARWALDTAERGVRAYAGAWIAVYVGGGLVLDAFDASFVESLYAAAFGTLVSFAFSLAAKPSGATDSASFLPTRTDPPQP